MAKKTKKPEKVKRPTRTKEEVDGVATLRFVAEGADGSMAEVTIKSTGMMTVNGRNVTSDYDLYLGFKQFLEKAGLPVKDPEPVGDLEAKKPSSKTVLPSSKKKDEEGGG